MTAPKNIAASVRARLTQLARDRGDEVQLVLARYANERLLYRTQSPHAKQLAWGPRVYFGRLV